MSINLVVFRLNTWNMWSFSLSVKLHKLLVRILNYVKSVDYFCRLYLNRKVKDQILPDLN